MYGDGAVFTVRGWACGDGAVFTVRGMSVW